jgi:hypothetical protein
MITKANIEFIKGPNPVAEWMAQPYTDIDAANERIQYLKQELLTLKAEYKKLAERCLNAEAKIKKSS